MFVLPASSPSTEAPALLSPAFYATALLTAGFAALTAGLATTAAALRSWQPPVR